MKVGISIAIAIIVIGGGVWYFSQSDSTNTTNTTAGTNTSTGASDSRTVAQLMEDGDPMKCTFAITDASSEQSWTMYIDGQNVRGDYEVAANGTGDWDGHIITDAEYNYQWGRYGGQSYATKIKLDTVDTNVNSASETTANTNSRSVDYDQSMNMDCNSWNPDDSLFVPPSDVTFTDLSVQMEQVNQLLQTQCAACDTSTDPAACKQALGCS